jgi:hypothetical protein
MITNSGAGFVDGGVALSCDDDVLEQVRGASARPRLAGAADEAREDSQSLYRSDIPSMIFT